MRHVQTHPERRGIVAKDKRLYARFDIGFDEHDKIFPLTDQAFRALVEATLYSRRQLTDGFLAERLAVKRWGVEVLEELSTNDPVKPSLVRVDGGWVIHDFAEHQTTTAEIEELREARSEAGRRGGLASAQARAKAKRKQMLEQTGSKINPESESESESESETETERLLTKSVSLDVSRENKTDGLKNKSSSRPIDPHRICELVETVCDIAIDETVAQRMAGWIVSQAPEGVQYPHAYTERAIKNDPMKILEWLSTEVRT